MYLGKQFTLTPFLSSLKLRYTCEAYLLWRPESDGSISALSGLLRSLYAADMTLREVILTFQIKSSRKVRYISWMETAKSLAGAKSSEVEKEMSDRYSNVFNVCSGLPECGDIDARVYEATVGVVYDNINLDVLSDSAIKH